jgi:hypothetical protein
VHVRTVVAQCAAAVAPAARAPRNTDGPCCRHRLQGVRVGGPEAPPAALVTHCWAGGMALFARALPYGGSIHAVTRSVAAKARTTVTYDQGQYTTGLAKMVQQTQHQIRGALRRNVGRAPACTRPVPSGSRAARAHSKRTKRSNHPRGRARPVQADKGVKPPARPRLRAERAARGVGP